MEKWAKVVGAGVVDIGELPKSHTVKGRTYTGLRKMPDATLRAWGFYRYYEDAPPEFDIATHFLGSSLSFNGESVIKEYFVLEKDLETVKAAKLAELAAARYAAEIAGITVSGATIATDRTSQAMITGAALKATQDETYSCQWKTTAQGFATLTAAQIIAIADAVRDHVQGCFDAEATLAGQVEAIEINETTTLAQALAAVNAIAWLEPE